MLATKASKREIEGEKRRQVIIYSALESKESSSSPPSPPLLFEKESPLSDEGEQMQLILRVLSFAFASFYFKIFYKQTIKKLRVEMLKHHSNEMPT